ncbi:MAG: hypothetical protein ACI837_000178 [Crocinitomicaceae bacterium]|jgi:hypothetical protein
MLHKILSISIIVLASASYAQKKEVTLTITPKDAEVGETVMITVETNVEGDIDIENLPGSFIYGSSSGSQMFQRMDYSTGNVITYYSISQTGVIGKSGTYKIGPAFVKSRGKSYGSNRVTVHIGKKSPMSIGSISAQQLKDPAFGVVQTSKSSIYEGEPVVVSAKIYAKYQPTNIVNYLSFIQGKAIESHTLSQGNNLKVREEKYKGYDYYSFEHDKYVIFPLGTGVFDLGPYSVDVLQGRSGFSLTSSNALITIKALPPNPPKDFIGAVGEFKVTRKLDTTQIKQGDVFVMMLVVEGTGNIQNILAPTLDLPKGFIIYGDPVVSENISYGARGAEGFISYEYNVQVSRHGKLNFPGTTISYFDPVTEKYIQTTSDEHSISVKQDQSYKIAETSDSENDEGEFELAPELLRLKKDVRSTDSMFGSSLFWTGVGAPLICALFFILFTRRREKDADEIEARQVIRQKDKQLSDYVAKSKELLSSDDNDAFFSSIEAALRKAFEVKMNIQQERILSKNEITNYLVETKQEQLSDQVQSLFRTCEESRYGYGSMDTVRQPALSELTKILKTLKL